MNTIESNVSFKANLNIRKIKGNKVKWQNIAREFEAQTKRYPKDTFSLSSSNGVLKFNIDGNMCDENYITEPLLNKILQLPEDKIAKKLKILFGTIKKLGAMEEEFVSLNNKYIDKQGVSQEVSDNFWGVLIGCERALMDRHLKRDRMLYANSKDIVLADMFVKK